MKTPSKYYIEVTSATYTGDDLADYLENGPLYRDDEGTASDVTCEVAALRAENERLRDLHWREVESLRERLDKEEEERGRQYGMRVQAEERAAFLLELLRATVRTGTKDPLLDARLAEEIRSHE